ncbi:hypothetical protein [Cyclobacterium amurskyense]|uniref:hypothetical protein n=1 Tax=Cyclobacterium amurskyense TaxID=320787 RepID=UPI0030D88810
MKNLLIILLILVFGFIAFLLVKDDFFDSKLNGLEVVPSNAIFVFETNDPVGYWNNLVNQPVWEKLHNLPALADVESQLVLLDSITGKNGNLDKYLKGHRFRLSLHPIGKGAFGFLISVAFENEHFFEFLKNLEEGPDNGIPGLKKRNYSGVELYEFKTERGEQTFTFTRFENVLMGSHTSFLVEDGIRYAKSLELKNFKQSQPHLFQPSTPLNSRGVLRFSGEGFAALVNELTDDNAELLLKNLRENKLSSNLVPAFSDTSILFSGQMYTNGTTGTMEFEGNVPSGLSFAPVISNRAAWVTQYLFSSFQGFKQIPNLAFKPRPLIVATLDESLEIQDFLNGLGGEATMVLEENLFDRNPNQILLLHPENTARRYLNLEKFALEVSQNDSTKLFKEYFMGKEIFMLDIEEFPAHIFEGNFTGFSRSYVSMAGDHLIIGNSLKTVKNLLEDFYNDNTWGKSFAYKDLLKEQNNGAPIRLILNNDRFYPILIQNSDAAWSPVFQKYAPIFRSFDWLNISIFKEGSVQINLDIDLGEPEINRQMILSESRSTSFDKPLIFGPKGIQNFNDRSTDFLVQDEDNFIHLISGEGERVFSQRIPGAVLSEVHQIDYFKNGKLQLVFATRDFIYALDRYGNLLPEYPIPFVEDKEIAFLNVLDYDNNRSYRYFVADTEGDLYLYDQKGNLLEGWSPNTNSAGPLSYMPGHHREPGLGDFMVSLHNNGKLNLFNRKGESKVGGGILLGDGISTAYAIEESKNKEPSKLVTVNEAGEVINVNFKGELTYRNQLLRPDTDTKFNLVNDQNKSDYVWVIEEYNKLKVLKPNEQVFFEMSIPSSALEYKYFSFGDGNKIFAVLDKVQDFAYLYNGKGQLINQKPISISQSLWINFSGSENEYTLVTVYGDKLYEYKIPL